jgi:hypothetical protein
VTRQCRRCDRPTDEPVLRILDQGSGPGVARYYCPPCDRRLSTAIDCYDLLVAIARARRGLRW